MTGYPSARGRSRTHAGVLEVQDYTATVLDNCTFTSNFAPHTLHSKVRSLEPPQGVQCTLFLVMRAADLLCRSVLGLANLHSLMLTH